MCSHVQRGTGAYPHSRPAQARHATPGNSILRMSPSASAPVRRGFASAPPSLARLIRRYRKTSAALREPGFGMAFFCLAQNRLCILRNIQCPAFIEALPACAAGIAHRKAGHIVNPCSHARSGAARLSPHLSPAQAVRAARLPFISSAAHGRASGAHRFGNPFPPGAFRYALCAATS